MTNEEAIKELSVLWDRMKRARTSGVLAYKTIMYYDSQYVEALEMAIKALEATDPSRFAMAKIQPNEDCTSEEEITDIILSIARNLEHICEVIRK